MTNIKAKIDQINQLIKEVREYKAAHPTERLGYWLGFDDCVETMETQVRSRRYNELLLLLDKLSNNYPLDESVITEMVKYLETHREDVLAARILLGAK